MLMHPRHELPAALQPWMDAIALDNRSVVLRLMLYTHAATFFALSTLAPVDEVRFAFMAGAAALLLLSLLSEPNQHPRAALPWLATLIIQSCVVVMLALQDSLSQFSVAYLISCAIPMLLILGVNAALATLALNATLLTTLFILEQQGAVKLGAMTVQSHGLWLAGAYLGLHAVLLPPLLLSMMARARLTLNMQQQNEVLQDKQSQLHEQRQREQQDIAWLSASLCESLRHLDATAGASELPAAAKQGVRSLRQRAEALREFAQLEAGQLEVRPQPVLWRPWLSAWASAWAQQHPHIALTLEPTDPSLVPERLHLDPQRVEQILNKLLQHAAAQSQAGEAHLKVAIVGGDLLSLRLHFSHVDISPATLQHLVDTPSLQDVYLSPHAATDTMALTMANALAHLLDGDIQILSSVGQGSQFDVTLPLRPESARTNASGPQPPLALPPASTRVLLVDDNPVSRMTWTTRLHRRAPDLGIWTVASVAAAEDVLRELNMDIVLMDIHMPDMDGIAGSRHLRQTLRGNCPPIIGLCASVHRDLEQAALASGMFAVLDKSCAPEHLLRTITQALTPTQDTPST